MASSRNPSNRLRTAVQENNLPLVTRLRYKTDIRNTDTSRLTSLALAALSCSEEVFEWLLLDAGHDDDELSRDADNSTILHMIASLPCPLTPPEKKQAEVFAAAVRMSTVYWEQFPFLMDWSNSGGKTALHIAAQSGNSELVKTLCELGADFNLSDLQGNTPLHYASAYNHPSVISALLSFPSCSYSLRNLSGFTPIEYSFSLALEREFGKMIREVVEERKVRRLQGSSVSSGISGGGNGMLDDGRIYNGGGGGNGIGLGLRSKESMGTMFSSSDGDHSGSYSHSHNSHGNGNGNGNYNQFQYQYQYNSPPIGSSNGHGNGNSYIPEVPRRTDSSNSATSKQQPIRPHSNSQPQSYNSQSTSSATPIQPTQTPTIPSPPPIQHSRAPSFSSTNAGPGLSSAGQVGLGLMRSPGSLMASSRRGSITAVLERANLNDQSGGGSASTATTVKEGSSPAIRPTPRRQESHNSDSSSSKAKKAIKSPVLAAPTPVLGEVIPPPTAGATGTTTSGSRTSSRTSSPALPSVPQMPTGPTISYPSSLFRPPPRQVGSHSSTMTISASAASKPGSGGLMIVDNPTKGRPASIRTHTGGGGDNSTGTGTNSAGASTGSSRTVSRTGTPGPPPPQPASKSSHSHSHSISQSHHHHSHSNSQSHSGLVVHPNILPGQIGTSGKVDKALIPPERPPKDSRRGSSGGSSVEGTPSPRLG